MKLPSQVEHLVNRASLEYAFTALARPLLAGLTVAEPVLNGGDCLLRSQLSKPPLMLSARGPYCQANVAWNLKKKTKAIQFTEWGRLAAGEPVIVNPHVFNAHVVDVMTWYYPSTVVDLPLKEAAISPLNKPTSQRTRSCRVVRYWLRYKPLYLCNRFRHMFTLWV